MRHDHRAGTDASGDYARASELQYGRLPDLERQLAAERDPSCTANDQPDTRMLKEEVDEDDIAEVVNKLDPHSGDQSTP